MKTSFLNIEPKPAQGFYFYGMRNDNIEGLASVQLISENLVVIMKNFGDNPSDLICTNYSRIDTSYFRIDTNYSRIDTSYSRIDTSYFRIDTNYSRIDTSYSRIDTNYSRIDTSYSRIDTSYSRIDMNYSRTYTSYSLIYNFGDDYANCSKLICHHLAVNK